MPRRYFPSAAWGHTWPMRGRELSASAMLRTGFYSISISPPPMFRGIAYPPGIGLSILNAMATSLTNQLNDVRSTSVCSLIDPLKRGYSSVGSTEGIGNALHVIFRHAANSTEATPYLHPPGFNHPFGSGKVLELVDSGDRRFRQYSEPPRNRIVTLAQAIERTRNDVRAQCDPEAMTVDELTCRGIGGRIQMATITTSHGFRWVTGFEPG